jgi:hypothetical protein
MAASIASSRLTRQNTVSGEKKPEPGSMSLPRFFRYCLNRSLAGSPGDGFMDATPTVIRTLYGSFGLILDDWGLEKMTLSQRNDLLEIMEDRHGLKSTLITS